MGFFLFIAVGLLLLLLAYLVARQRDPRTEGGAAALVEAQRALNSLQTSLLPSGMVERLFDQRDLAFVRGASGKPVQKVFLAERQQMALAWVRQLRTHVLSLKRFHSRQSRLYAGLNLRTELDLGLTFASLLVLCGFLEAVFHFAGPYAAPRVVASVTSAAEGVCTASKRSLAFLASEGTQGLGNGPAGNEHAA